MSDSTLYDLVIVGGGMVGASLALALRESGLRLALVEAVDRQANSQPSYDDRTLVLNQVSCQWLRETGLWSEVADAATPIRRIHVSALGRFGQTHLRAEQHGLSAFGHVLQARRLGQTLLPAVANIAACEMHCPARLLDLNAQSNHLRLWIENHSGTQEIRARLLVGADGADSQVRQLLGLPVQEYDYQQTAIISNVSADRDHDGCAYERLTESGPLALLPHGPGRMGLVWTVASADAAALLSASDSEFLRQLRQRFGRRLGEFRRVGQRTAYPLRLVYAPQALAPRALLMGNAAHTIHPISAQGFNLGLRDALVLAATLKQRYLHRNANFDPGDAALLQRYQAQRAPDQEGTIRYTDGLVRLYRNPSPLGQWLGSAALVAHHFFPPLQRRLVRQTLGYRCNINVSEADHSPLS